MRHALPAFSALALAVPAAMVLMVSQSNLSATVQGAQNPAASAEFYTAKVRPILETNCGRCHLGENHRGGFNMETRAALLKGGHDGKVVAPGDPANSLLVKLIRHEGPADDPMPMPPKKPKISDDDIATISQWIAAGAVMPDSGGNSR